MTLETPNSTSTHAPVAPPESENPAPPREVLAQAPMRTYPDSTPDRAPIEAVLDTIDQHIETAFPYLIGPQVPHSEPERTALEASLREIYQRAPQLIAALRHALIHVPPAALERLEEILIP